MITKAIWIGLIVSLGFVPARGSQADEWKRKMVLIFSQPVEIPGRVLPAGSYTFRLADSNSKRHLVQVFSADDLRSIAIVTAISNRRSNPTGEPVILFREMPAGPADAIYALSYPGSTMVYELEYPQERAAQLASAVKTVRPAVEVVAVDYDPLETAPIGETTPDGRAVPMAAAVRTIPERETPARAGAMQTVQNTGSPRQSSQTAGLLPLVVLFGLGSIGVAAGLVVTGRRALRHAV